MTPPAVATPPRSLDQRMAALDYANAVRTKRAALKREIGREGSAALITVIEIIRDPAPDLATMKLAELIEACPKVGKVKCDRVLRAAQASHRKTLGDLSDRQRRTLIRELHAKLYPGHVGHTLAA